MEEKDCKMAVPPPVNFSFVPEEWAKYKARFLRYLSLAGANNKSEEDKKNCLMYCMGEKAEDIKIQFVLKQNTFNELIEKFDDFFLPKRNVIYERYRFNTRIQKNGEKFDDFVTDLHKIAESCLYGIIKGELIRDRIVIGALNKGASDRMLLKRDLTLDEAVQMGRQAEMQQEETK